MTMTVARHQLQLETNAPIAVIDISDRIRQWVAERGLRNGLLTVSSLHTTARVNLNEREAELQHDMVAFLERLVPREAAYRHNVNTVDDRDNAHAHLLGLLINASESIPIADGMLVMGGWQSIFFIELDGPRSRREVELHFIGEV